MCPLGVRVDGSTEGCRDPRGGLFLDQLVQDLRYAARTLRRTPGFTVVAILTLALGIGATTAMFAVVDSILLSPLPYPDSERLVWVWSTDPHGLSKQPTSYPDFLDWRTQSRTMDFVSWGGYQTTLTGTAEPVRLTAAVTAGDLLTLLGVPPLLGTTGRFENGTPQEPVVVLSHQLWQRRFDSDAAVLGRPITLSGLSGTIAGVMPADFRFPIQATPTVDLWVPLVQFNPALADHRGARLMEVIGRLRPNTSLGQAQAEMDVIAAGLSRQYPATNRNIGVRLVPAVEEVTGDVSLGLWVLLAAVGALLFMACVNIANLFLARAQGRRREFAIRAALGGGTARLGLQLLTEGSLIAAGGGAAGCLLASWGVDALVALAPSDLPRAQEVAVNSHVLGLAVLVSSMTGLLFALAPAWCLLPGHLGSSLHGVAGTASAGRRGRLQGRVLVVGEVALAMMLLTGAGLFLNSFWRLNQPDLGFDPENVLTFSLEWPSSEYPRPHLAFRDLRTRLLAIPGVEAVSTGLQLPDRGLPMIEDESPLLGIEGQPTPAAERRRTSVLFTQPGYFRAMGIPLARGRDFSEEDVSGPAPVAIINDSLARTYFPQGDALGQRVVLDSWRLFDKRAQEVIGVASDVKHRGLTTNPEPLVYLPRVPGSGAESPIVVRTNGDPLMFVGAVREAVASLDERQPLYDIQTLEQRIAGSLAQERFSALLLGGFSAFGVLLAGIGLYGVVSHVTTQRTREFGIRAALGATAWETRRLVLSQGMKLVCLGVLIGCAGAGALSGLIESLLFGVAATDPLTFGLVAMLLASVAALACWIPARYATNVSPIVALRQE